MADEDIQRRLDDLEDAVGDLRRELSGRRGPSTPRRFMSATADYGIPAVIAGLRANIRALELAQEAIRDRERSEQPRSPVVTALDRVDAAIEDAQRAIERGDVPDPLGANEVITDARAIQREIRELIDDSEHRQEPRGRVVPIEVVEEDPSVDIDEELETIKDEVERESDES